MYKRIALMLAVMLLLGDGVVFADSNDNADRVVGTNRGYYTTPDPALTDILNTNDVFYHNHSVYIPKRDNYSHGYGVDLLLYKAEDGSVIDNMTTEYRYNQTYDEHSVYSVVGINGPAIVNTVKEWFR